ncbi:CLUMA_CG016070, isoform A [Clunio marinus]|uniref:CLUMA_CG016070, isoform A n=1 Tax=Clunio marinus TaxID=568069 RepID=A0A1J1IQX5_9DIPT|nr:CLUMA_CG016070, isoform A [Clunio marinus]
MLEAQTTNNNHCGRSNRTNILLFAVRLSGNIVGDYLISRKSKKEKSSFPELSNAKKFSFTHLADFHCFQNTSVIYFSHFPQTDD